MPNLYGNVMIKPEGLAPLPEGDKGAEARPGRRPGPAKGISPWNRLVYADLLVTNGTESAGRACRVRLNWVIGWRT
jgi:hypothetical protein